MGKVRKSLALYHCDQDNQREMSHVVGPTRHSHLKTGRLGGKEREGLLALERNSEGKEEMYILIHRGESGGGGPSSKRT